MTLAGALWCPGKFPRNNTGRDGHVFTAPVKALGPQNELGLHNMIGNVWEWVADYWTTDHRPPADGLALVDPQGPPTPQGGGTDRVKKVEEVTSYKHKLPREGRRRAAVSN